MKNLLLTFRRHWMEVLLAVFLVAIGLQMAGSYRTDRNGEADLSRRIRGYPETYISQVNVDLTSPNHWVTLSWAGPKAKNQETGPFHSSAGGGLGTNNCDEETESKRLGSNCTPKGRMVVEGFGEHLPSNAKARFVTWISMQREIALHSYPEVPDYHVSHGCVRLSEEAAQLIHNNSVVGDTVVDIAGNWTRLRVVIDRDELLEQLIAHEGRRRTVYEDSLGYPTIGVGFNLKRADARQTINNVGADYERVLTGEVGLTEEQIDELLEHDVDEALENCQQVFPEFLGLSEVRQRVLVDMMFNLGLKRFSTFKKMIAAVKARDFQKSADEMKDSKWYVQVKSRAITLEAMMRTGADDKDATVADNSDPIVDCRMTREEALDGLRADCPEAIRDRQELIDVEYYSFDGKLHRGQLVIDIALESEIEVIFQIMLDYRFPIGSVIPLSAPKFRKDGVWDDELSMDANNTSAFNYRKTTGEQVLSQHALGRAIDINPMQNPYVNRDVVLPKGATYSVSEPGALSSDHPIVQAFLELGWEWGGLWRNQKDYQHFEKPTADVQ